MIWKGFGSVLSHSLYHSAVFMEISRKTAKMRLLMIQTGFSPGITKIQVYIVISRPVHLMRLSLTLWYLVSRIPVWQYDAEDTRLRLRWWHIMVFQMPMPFKYPPSAVPTSSSIKWLILCLEHPAWRMYHWQQYSECRVLREITGVV